MKKALSILLCIFLALSATACTSRDNLETKKIVESYSLENLPEYAGEPYVEINDNIPLLAIDESSYTSYEKYASLDSLGRCGVCIASIGPDIMPTEDRGSIGSVKPTGWQTVKYDFVDGRYLYNRCHLIGFQLTGENANEKNLITGTRSMNVDGMLPFENMVADYVKETGNHVLYRVTPIYEGENLLASGVLMEAISVEDEGAGISFCVYCYNAEPGVAINYENGDSCEDVTAPLFPQEPVSSQEQDYVLNKSSKKFHIPTCSGVQSMSEKNKEEYHGTSQELIDKGYEPCGSCNP